jgi:hypothetical protein
MDFILEDVGLMASELNRWEEECRKYEMELEADKRKTGAEDDDIPFFAPSGKYVTVDEIYKMQRDAYKELSETDEFKKSQQLIEDARDEAEQAKQDAEDARDEAETARLLNDF